MKNKIGKRIPISWAKKIANELGYTQVIIHAYDGESNMQCVTTYGKTIADCENAAKGGNTIKRLLEWPEELCNAKPKRTIPKVPKNERSQLNEGTDKIEILPKIDIKKVKKSNEGI